MNTRGWTQERDTCSKTQGKRIMRRERQVTRETHITGHEKQKTRFNGNTQHRTHERDI